MSSSFESSLLDQGKLDEWKRILRQYGITAADEAAIVLAVEEGGVLKPRFFLHVFELQKRSSYSGEFYSVLQIFLSGIKIKRTPLRRVKKGVDDDMSALTEHETNGVRVNGHAHYQPVFESPSSDTDHERASGEAVVDGYVGASVHGFDAGEGVHEARSPEAVDQETVDKSTAVEYARAISSGDDPEGASWMRVLYWSSSGPVHQDSLVELCDLSSVENLREILGDLDSDLVEVEWRGSMVRTRLVRNLG